MMIKKMRKAMKTLNYRRGNVLVLSIDD